MFLEAISLHIVNIGMLDFMYTANKLCWHFLHSSDNQVFLTISRGIEINAIKRETETKVNGEKMRVLQMSV